MILVLASNELDVLIRVRRPANRLGEARHDSELCVPYKPRIRIQLLDFGVYVLAMDR